MTLTGYVGPEDRDRTLAGGFQTHVRKPVDPDKLVAPSALSPPPGADAPSCAACGCSLGESAGFQFHGPGGRILKCLPCACRHGPLLARSLRIAAVVGTILIAINQGDTLVRGGRSPALAWKVPLTYLVPFLVATCGALVNVRMR